MNINDIVKVVKKQSSEINVDIFNFTMRNLIKKIV